MRNSCEELSTKAALVDGTVVRPREFHEIPGCRVLQGLCPRDRQRSRSHQTRRPVRLLPPPRDPACPAESAPRGGSPPYLFIAITTLEERVRVKEEFQTMFRRSTFEQILPDRFWHKHARKKNAQLRHQIEMVQSDETGAVNGTAPRSHLTLATGIG